MMPRLTDWIGGAALFVTLCGALWLLPLIGG